MLQAGARAPEDHARGRGVGEGERLCHATGRARGATGGRALRGFPGAGQLKLPFALEQVGQTWKLYGGEGSSPHLLEIIAEEGREFILASLRRFGQVSQAFIPGKNPEAARFCTETPLAARRRFEQHASSRSKHTSTMWEAGAHHPVMRSAAAATGRAPSRHHSGGTLLQRAGRRAKRRSPCKSTCVQARSWW